MESDKDLNEHLVRAGDKKAFESFYGKHFNSVVAYLRMFIKNRDLAKDIAQQSFIKLWIKRTSVPKDVPLKKYLFRVAKNHFIDQHRAKEVENKALEKFKIEALRHSRFENTATVMRRIELLRKAIEELPPKCREILLLSKMEGLAYKQIALRLDISVKTVESQMRIAYTKIRAFIIEMEASKK